MRAGTDAWEAKWFSVDVAAEVTHKDVKNDEVFVETDYEITFSNEESNLILTALLKETKTFRKYHESVCYEIVESEGLAFDHGKNILTALLRLRNDVEHDLRIAFDFMPEKFTLTGLQNVYELILDKKLLTANFRRKISDYVIETDEMIEGEGFRPAKLFQRNVEAFYSCGE